MYVGILYFQAEAWCSIVGGGVLQCISVLRSQSCHVVTIPYRTMGHAREGIGVDGERRAGKAILDRTDDAYHRTPSAVAGG